MLLAKMLLDRVYFLGIFMRRDRGCGEVFHAPTSFPNEVPPPGSQRDVKAVKRSEMHVQFTLDGVYLQF